MINLVGMGMEKKKAEWQRELEKPGWRISKGFDHAHAVQNEPTPWWEGLYWGAIVFGCPLLFLGCVGLIVYGLFFKA